MTHIVLWSKKDLKFSLDIITKTHKRFENVSKFLKTGVFYYIWVVNHVFMVHLALIS